MKAPVIETYMEKLDPNLSYMDHYFVEISIHIEQGDIITELSKKMELSERQGYPYYRNEFPDREKRDIVLFQRKTSLFLPRDPY